MQRDSTPHMTDMVRARSGQRSHCYDNAGLEQLAIEAAEERGALERPEVDHVDDLGRAERGEHEPGGLVAVQQDVHQCERCEQDVQPQQDVQHDAGQHVDGERRHAARDDVDELAAAGGVKVAAAASVASAIAERKQGTSVNKTGRVDSVGTVA